MPRYIDAEKLEQRLIDFSDWCRDNRKDGVDFVLNGVLVDTPTADVQEVKHASWIHYDEAVRCSNCGQVTNDFCIDGDMGSGYYTVLPHYCSNCGARMGE